MIDPKKSYYISFIYLVASASNQLNVHLESFSKNVLKKFFLMCR